MSSKFKTHIIATQYMYVQVILDILHSQYNIMDDLASEVQPVATVGAPPVWITLP